jgi:hypothetical protein
LRRVYALNRTYSVWVFYQKIVYILLNNSLINELRIRSGLRTLRKSIFKSI